MTISIKQLNGLSQVLEKNSQAIFAHNGYAIEVEEGCDADFTYTVYSYDGHVYDGGEFDGSTTEVIEMLLTDY